MIAKILIWLYIIFVVPPLAIIMVSLAYGGAVEISKSLTKPR
jgi:hypothetical protein